MPKSNLTSEDKRRYSRNIMLPEIGKEGQLKLSNARVAIVGSGALGSITAMYLAGSGIGHIDLFDFDTIDISNLQRQLSFTESDLGKKKVDITAQRLSAINSDIEVVAHDFMLTKANINQLLGSADLVIEGSDNPATKYLISDTCHQLGTPYVLGGVSGFSGQVMSWKPGFPGYRDLFPDAAAEGGFTPCSLGGILGPLPGIVGSIQSSEAIKILCEIGSPLFGRLLLIDALTMNFSTIDI